MQASDFLKLTRPELDDLFKKSPPGPIPEGDSAGTAIACPGTFWAGLIARLVRTWAWQGKVFTKNPGSDDATLLNKVSVGGVQAIVARVYFTKSWLDGNDCIVLDYSKTSLFARKIRDEIRLVDAERRLYLGKVWWGKTRLIDFALEFPPLTMKAFCVPRAAAIVAAVLVAGVGLWLVLRFTSNEPVTYRDDADHFKYGSTGGEIESGIPYAIWKALPDLFVDKLPDRTYRKDREYASFGFIYEDGHDLPIGTSERRVQGIDRVFLNCAVCHSGTVRAAPGDKPKIYLGMPANTVDLEAFSRFLFDTAEDPRFSTGLMPQIAAEGGGGLDCINRQILKQLAVYIMRDRLMTLGSLFTFTKRETEFGPGRFDTFNPPKALLNFPMDKIPEREWAGVVDFPGVWNQDRKERLQLHWDGNNTVVAERNRSAAFGTGAFPPTLDRPSLARTAAWMRTLRPDPYPFPIDKAAAERGQVLYAKYCLDCHGTSGSDFSGKDVGKVTPIEAIGTDRGRLDSYSEVLCAAQNTLYAGYGDERFSHFRKTYGYVNAPLDGLWLRAPYLHNGSVPTLRDLLNRASERPKEFWRGNDVYDTKNVGFVSTLPAQDGRKFFHYETLRDGKPIPGNGNAGHEGAIYGTELPDADKAALVEYLKTF